MQASDSEPSDRDLQPNDSEPAAGPVTVPPRNPVKLCSNTQYDALRRNGLRERATRRQMRLPVSHSPSRQPWFSRQPWCSCPQSESLGSLGPSARIERDEQCHRAGALDSDAMEGKAIGEDGG